MTKHFLLGAMFGMFLFSGATLSFFLGGFLMAERLLDRQPDHRLEVLK